MPSAIRKSLFLTLLLCCTFAVNAEETVTSKDGYTIHHSALKSDFLDADVATRYGLPRSKYRGMVNIAVIKDAADSTGTPVPAKIEIEAANLMQKPKSIDLREIREGDAIYYIGDFPVIDQEIVNFKLRVKPENSNTLINAKFSQKFYID